MKWVAFALIIIAVWLIYSRRKGKITMTKEQAGLALGLVRKELAEIENKRQKIIDDGAAEGKTVPIESIFSRFENESDEFVKLEIEKQKQELLNKYGPNLPVDVVYRLMKQWDPNEESPWSDSPGCFERHLQRREGNLMFPPERRIVTHKEIEEAREKDRVEQQKFVDKVNAFVAKIKALGQSATPDQVGDMLKEIQAILEEAASIGGNIEHYVRTLEGTEETLMQSMTEVIQDIEEPLKEIYSLSVSKRSPYIAQLSRIDSPILKEEQLSTLLSEDLQTISLEGYRSRAFAPNYRPNEADISTHLENAVSQGFSKERAAQIMAAWNEIKDE